VILPFYGQMHLWSFFVLIIAFLLPFILIKNLHIIYKFMFSALLGVFSKGILEVCYFLGSGQISYIDIMLAFVAGGILLLYNHKFHILRINRLVFGLCVLQVIIFIGLWFTGFWPTLADSPIWIVSKANGMLMWLSLIDTKKKTEVK
jgi:hypothetical protein